MINDAVIHVPAIMLIKYSLQDLRFKNRNYWIIELIVLIIVKKWDRLFRLLDLF